ncbi:MAG: DUF3224 domain-containing protein [Gemmatimonadales bacterium]
MSNKVDASFQVNSWDEKPFHEIDGGPKLTRASLTKTFRGDLEGEGTLEYLMIHGKDGVSSFMGVERVVGSLGGRSGSFVLQHSGTFENGAATCTWFVVPGSGTGELGGLTGTGGFESAHAEDYPMTLEYDFE